MLLLTTAYKQVSKDVVGFASSQLGMSSRLLTASRMTPGLNAKGCIRSALCPSTQSLSWERQPVTLCDGSHCCAGNNEAFHLT
jgi:hypothetical protein